MLRLTVLALVVVSQASLATAALAANNGTLTRREIRAMPITERPSRPGHFYGNAVRRNYYRGAAQAAPYSNPGTIWQGYSTPARQSAWMQPGQVISEYVVHE